MAEVRGSIPLGSIARQAESAVCRLLRRPVVVVVNETRRNGGLRQRHGRRHMAGEMVHVEIPAGDTAKAREFWGGLFGWKFEEYPGSPTEYHTTRFSETQGGAIMGAEGDKRGARVYFDVDDINSGVARVKELGGEAGEAMP